MHRTKQCAFICFQYSAWHLEAYQLVLFYVKLNNLEALQSGRWGEMRGKIVKVLSKLWILLSVFIHNEINVNSFLNRFARKKIQDTQINVNFRRTTTFLSVSHVIICIVQVNHLKILWKCGFCLSRPGMAPRGLYFYVLTLATCPKLFLKEEFAEDNIVKCSFRN